MKLCEQFAQNFAFVLTRLQLAIKLQAYGIAFVMPPWALFYATFIGSLRHALTPLSNTGMSDQCYYQMAGYAQYTDFQE